MKSRPIIALVAAEITSILGSRMTYLALPWFVLVTTGSPAKMTIVLAAEILPMAIFGIPSGMVVERLGARTTMLVCDARPRAAPGLAADPALARPAQLPASARARLRARLLHGPVLRGAAGDPAGARRRGRGDDRAGEQHDRRRNRFRRARRPAARRDPDPVPRRAERAVRRRGDLRRLVPAARRASCRRRRGSALRSPHGVLAGIQFFVRDKLLARLGHRP